MPALGCARYVDLSSHQGECQHNKFTTFASGAGAPKEPANATARISPKSVAWCPSKHSADSLQLLQLGLCFHWAMS